nr:putative acetyltransferase [uncultured bacterium]
MPEPSALERVRDVFVAVLGVPREVLLPEATPEQVPGWDSLAHLSLVSEIEKAFGVSLTLDEVLAVSCVGDFVSLATGAPPGAGEAGADRMLPGDREAIFDFAGQVKDEITLVHSPAHWDWQYLGNPAVEPGRPPVYLLRQGGRIAGHLGTIPVTLEVDGVGVRAAWTAGLVAAPEVRARGGGVRLIDRWLSECDVGLVLGTTPDAEALFTQLGWLRPGGGHVRSYMRLLDADAVVRKRVSNPAARKAIASVANAALSLILRAPSRLGGDIKVRTFDRFDARFDDLWERVRKGYRLIVRRDRRYLAWKFASQPDVEYIRILAERDAPGVPEGTLAGYAVLRVMKRKPYVGYIVDLLAGADDAEAWNHLVAASVDVLLARGVQQVWCVVMNPTAEAALRRFAFVLRDSPMTFFVRPNAPGLDPALFADAANWFVTKGDADQDRP